MSDKTQKIVTFVLFHALKHLINAASVIIDEAVIQITKKGFLIVVMDESHICLARIELPFELLSDFTLIGEAELKAKIKEDIATFVKLNEIVPEVKWEDLPNDLQTKISLPLWSETVKIQKAELQKITEENVIEVDSVNRIIEIIRAQMMLLLATKFKQDEGESEVNWTVNLNKKYPKLHEYLDGFARAFRSLNANYDHLKLLSSDLKFAFDAEICSDIMKAIPGPKSVKTKKLPRDASRKKGKSKDEERNYRVKLEILKEVNQEEALRLREGIIAAMRELLEIEDKIPETEYAVIPSALVEIFNGWGEFFAKDVDLDLTIETWLSTVLEKRLHLDLWKLFESKPLDKDPWWKSHETISSLRPAMEKWKKLVEDYQKVGNVIDCRLITDVANVELPVTLDWDEEKVPPTAELDVQFDVEADVPTWHLVRAIELGELVSDTLDFNASKEALVFSAETKEDIFEYKIPLSMDVRKSARGVFSLSFLKNLSLALDNTEEFKIHLAHNAPLKLEAKIGGKDEERLNFMAFLAPRVEEEESYESDEPTKEEVASPFIASPEMIRLERQSDVLYEENLPRYEEASENDVVQLFTSIEGLVILSQFYKPVIPNKKLDELWDKYFTQTDIVLIKGDLVEPVSFKFFQKVIMGIQSEMGGDESLKDSSKNIVQFLQRSPAFYRWINLIRNTEKYVPTSLDGVNLLLDFLASSKSRDADIEITFPTEKRWGYKFEHKQVRVSVYEYEHIFSLFVAFAEKISPISEAGINLLREITNDQFATGQNLRLIEAKQFNNQTLVMPLTSEDVKTTLRLMRSKFHELPILVENRFYNFKPDLEKIKLHFDVTTSDLRKMVEEWQEQSFSEESLAKLEKLDIEMLRIQSLLKDMNFLFDDLVKESIDEIRIKWRIEKIPKGPVETFDLYAVIDWLNEIESGKDLIDMQINALADVAFWSLTQIREIDRKFLKRVSDSIASYAHRKDLKEELVGHLTKIFGYLDLVLASDHADLYKIVDEIRILFGKYQFGKQVELLPSGIELADAATFLGAAETKLGEIIKSTSESYEKDSLTKLDEVVVNLRKALENLQADINSYRAEVQGKLVSKSKKHPDFREMWERAFKEVQSVHSLIENLPKFESATVYYYDGRIQSAKSSLQNIEAIFTSMHKELTPYIERAIEIAADQAMLPRNYLMLSEAISLLRVSREKPKTYKKLDSWRNV